MKTLTHLSAVDELGQGDVGLVAEDVDVVPSVGSAVLETETQEVANVRGRAAAELNGDGRGVVGCM
jgi:hypothetical protein